MTKRVQLNARVPDKLRGKVQEDSDRNPRITRDLVVAAIIDDFFSSWSVRERANFYQSYSAKNPSFFARASKQKP